jgi:hypothetical protein
VSLEAKAEDRKEDRSISFFLFLTDSKKSLDTERKYEPNQRLVQKESMPLGISDYSPHKEVD